MPMIMLLFGIEWILKPCFYTIVILSSALVELFFNPDRDTVLDLDFLGVCIDYIFELLYILMVIAQSPSLLQWRTSQPAFWGGVNTRVNCPVQVARKTLIGYTLGNMSHHTDSRWVNVKGMRTLTALDLAATIT